MSNILKKAALAVALVTASLSAHAAQTDIKVWAEVDNNLALLKADGRPLDDVVRLGYNPIRGLNPWADQVRIFSNDTTKDVQVRLNSPVELIPTNTPPGTPSVPMTVTLNKRVLDVAAQDFTAADLYDGAIPGASVSMELAVAQTTLGEIAAAGRYEGMVSVILALKP